MHQNIPDVLVFFIWYFMLHFGSSFILFWMLSNQKPNQQIEKQGVCPEFRVATLIWGHKFLTFLTLSWHFGLKLPDFQCWLEGERTNFRKHKTTTTQNIYFQNVEGKHKEKARYVYDLVGGLRYKNHFLFSMFASLLIFGCTNPLINQSKYQLF